MAYGEAAMADREYTEYFWDALDGLNFDQSLDDALDEDEKAIYESKIQGLDKALNRSE